jgi:ABC-type lipoprotein export system ATPase subunit
MSEQTLASAAAERGPLAMEAISISKDFRIGRGQTLYAVRDVSFNLYRGAVVALVGESGSGKSTAARLLAGQERLTSGKIQLDGKPVEVSSRRDFRKYKSKVQLVFQDPFASLNPVHTVRYHLERPVKLHQGKGTDVSKQIVTLIEQVRLTPAKQFLPKYPHELSGGQRQRVSFARALTEIAEDHGLVLAHENEKEVYGDIPDRCADLIGAVNSPALRATFDPANFVQCGVRPFSDAYRLLRPYLVYLQVKDALAATGEIVPAGQGDGQLRETLGALRDSGFAGFVSLEPHLAQAGRYGGFSGPQGFHRAAAALKFLLNELAISWR